MVLQEKTQKSLQQRVNVYLHGEYIVEECQDEAVEVLFDMLQQAEEELQKAKENLDATQERVGRLKSELAKVSS